MPENPDSSWIWSNTYKAAGQILECENLWGQKRYRVWFPSLNTVLLQRPDEIENREETAETAKASLVQFAATAGRLLDLLSDDKLLAPVDSAVIPLPHQIRALLSGSRYHREPTARRGTILGLREGARPSDCFAPKGRLTKEGS